MNANEYLVKGDLAMGRGSMLRIEDGRDLLLYVWEGAIWLTQEGDERDRYVEAGQWFRLDRHGLVLAHATRRATVSITAPVPELYARRIVLAKAGSAAPVELYSAAKAPASLAARFARFWAELFEPRARPTTASL
jgi:hypothetical protein